MRRTEVLAAYDIIGVVTTHKRVHTREIAGALWGPGHPRDLLPRSPAKHAPQPATAKLFFPPFGVNKGKRSPSSRENRETHLPLQKGGDPKPRASPQTPETTAPVRNPGENRPLSAETAARRPRLDPFQGWRGGEHHARTPQTLPRPAWRVASQAQRQADPARIPSLLPPTTAPAAPRP